jgi:hypothetical protein
MKKRINLQLLLQVGIFILTAVCTTVVTSNVQTANASSGAPVEIHLSSANNNFSSITTGISDIDNGTRDINSFGTPTDETTLNGLLPSAVAFFFDGLGNPSETSTPYLPITMDGGRTIVSLSDDSVSGNITLPFTVSMFGRDNDTISISSNGFIYLNQGNVNSFDSRCCVGALLSSITGSIDHMIAGSWVDLYPPGAGEISYETFGSAPNRVFVINYNNISPCCDTTGGNTWQIQLYEIPGAPTAPAAINDLNAIAGDQQATLTWSAPNDHGDPLTSYEVHYSNDGFAADDQICSTPDCTDLTPGATITGLTNGTFYAFKVYSYNGIGISPESNFAFTTPFIPSVPDAIVDLQVLARDQGVLLGWTDPKDNGSALTSYEVHYSNDGFTTNDQICSTPDCTDLITGTTVSGLTNGTPYSFRVYTYNSLGISPVSNTVTATPFSLNGPPAQWPSPSNPSDTIINNDADDQRSPSAVRTTDGNYIVFFDQSTIDGNLIYAQKVNATTGATIWVSPTSVSALTAQDSISDGHSTASSDNGAFVAFSRQMTNEPPFDYNVYVQKLDSTGQNLWGANGINVTTNSAGLIQESNPLMIGDNAGGVYVAWDLIGNFGTSEMYITHLDSTGAIAADWNTAGTDDYRTIHIEDGELSAERLGRDIWFQADGNIAIPYSRTTGPIFFGTTTAEMMVVQAQGGPSSPSILLSNSGISIGQFRAAPYGNYGAFAAYTTNGDVYVQRVDNNWNKEWGNDGFIASAADGDQVSLVPDGNGGIIVAWNFYEDADGGGVYGQHVLSSGSLDPIWGLTDVAIAPDGDGDPQTLDSGSSVISDGANGAYVAFFSDNTGYMYIQHVNADGTLGISGAGYPNGSSNDGPNYSPFLISDGDIGAVMFWTGYNLATGRDIYGQHLVPGAAPGSPDAITNLSGTPGSTQVSLTWTAPNDNGNPITDYVIQYNEGEGYVTFTDGVSTATTATVTGLTNFTPYTFRVYGVNSSGQGAASNEITLTPVPCASTRSNEQISDTPLTTVSDQCLGVSVTSGGLSLPYVPDSFIFPRKFSSTTNQNSFSNDNPATRSTVDVATGPEDVLTASDLTGSSTGFDVTITATSFTNGTDTIPLSRLYVLSSVPSSTTLNALNADLNGTVDAPNGIVYAAGSTGQDVVGMSAGEGDLNLAASYTDKGRNFDSDADNIADIVPIMHAPTGTAHMLSASQALNFYLNIPGNQPSGNYSILFTVDIMSIP